MKVVDIFLHGLELSPSLPVGNGGVVLCIYGLKKEPDNILLSAVIGTRVAALESARHTTLHTLHCTLHTEH